MSEDTENHKQQSDYWIQQWRDNKINFHQNSFEPFLEKHFPEMKPTTVLIPMCGKSKDILFFAQRGHQVIGVEVSELACDAFFSENGIKYTTENIEYFKIYKSKYVTIYCGDFFKVKPEFLNAVSFIYDRAALIALPKETRKNYVVRLLALCSNSSAITKTILLISLEHTAKERTGPPFSVDKVEIQSLYGSSFEVREVDSNEDKIISETHKGFRSAIVLERVYLLNQKRKISPNCGNTCQS